MNLIGRLLARHKPAWEQNWAAYPGFGTDRASAYLVDLGAVAAAPVISLPIRLDIEVAYSPEAADGLPVEHQISEIRAMGETLALACERLGGAFVGRVSSAGTCRLTAHLPTEPAEVPALPAGEPPATAQTQYDPQWAYVRDVLAPDERQLHVVGDLMVVRALSAHGDDLVTARPMEHVAYFAGRDAAEDAAGELRAAGYAVSVARNDEGEYTLLAIREDAVSPPALHERTWSVRAAVERRGGIYDGWTCELAGPPANRR